MVSWLTQHKLIRSARAWNWTRRAIVEIGIVILLAGVFVLKLTNYVDPSVLRPSTVAHTIARTFDNAASVIRNLPFLNSCARGSRMYDVSGGYVCLQGPDQGIYAHIYASYPLVGRGRESIYSDTDQGNIQVANDLLKYQFDLPRYKPVRMNGLPTWSENPYHAVYWRLEFYSLRPTLDLLYAFRTTGNEEYARQLRRLDLSFITAEGRSRWAWVDPHAVAFRSMALVDTWWKLRQDHQLPERYSTDILKELSKTGDYLANPNHYQPEDNHGTNEAAALYELAVAFPTLPHATQWLHLATERFEWQLNGLIDADGQLIENSPYYDFYTLEKYWQVYQYSVGQRQPIASLFASKIANMLHFATYILQPNSQVPLLGASIEATINDYGVYRGLAATDPQFLYVLTHGSQGSVPTSRSIYFPASGLSVLRSGWGSGSSFPHQTYLTFNIGRYRTEHSNLDALGLTLYGDGGDLLPDSGLYTYTRGPYRNFFHGTTSHNTVLVDGKSQAPGDGAAGPLLTGDGVTYQSAESSLYRGVTHRRMVMMLDPSHILVVDRLTSKSVHLYQQMFHLFPGARLHKNGLTVSGTGGTPGRELTIQQLLPGGIRESNVIDRRGRTPDGLCSQRYGVLLPCYAVSYSTRNRDATFMTLLTIGRPVHQGWRVGLTDGGKGLDIVDDSRHLHMDFGQGAGTPARAWATDPVPPRVKMIPVSGVDVPQDWALQGSGTSSQGATSTVMPRGALASVSTSSADPVYLVNNSVALNLQHQNARMKLRIKGLERASDLNLQLSNDHWRRYVTMSLADSYTQDYSGEWATIFLGPSGHWGQHGGWTASAPGFNWSQIDGIRVEVSAHNSSLKQIVVDIGGISLMPAQEQGKLVFVFDDGYQSILPAAQYMRQKGMAGNVAVIGKDVDIPTEDHLNLYQLKVMQNDWGWDMVNHTQDHVDAIRSYYDRHDMGAYAADILKQAVWLEANHLNSAPNWLIYPHGAVNEAVERVVSHYYMFARVVADNPDAWPYGDPRAISDLEIQYPGDGEGGDVGYTPPAEILRTVHNAIIHHMTVILTFHRIRSQAGDPPGYPLGLFKRIVNGVAASGIKVMTLSQLDRSNGVPVKNHIYLKLGLPSLITVRINT